MTFTKQMSKFKVAKNAFSDLLDDEDEEYYVKPQESSTASNQKSDFQPGAKHTPMTYSQIFEKACKDKNLASINELANVLDESLRIRQEERSAYCDKYGSYDKFNPEDYEKLLDKRINCFQTRYEDQDFINTVISRIPKEIKIDEIKALIDDTVVKLSKKKPTGHGSLFLIDLLFQKRPEIFNQAEDKRKLFYVKHDDIPRVGAPILWLISKAISKPSEVKMTTNELISLFVDELLSTSVSISGPYSVWASHLLRNHFDETKDSKISARNYTDLIPFYLRLKVPNGTNRDQHIKTVLNDLLGKFRIIDLENYAHEIIRHYPDFENAPKEVKFEFLDKARKSPEFVKGWASCHEDPEINEASKVYLQQISQVVPSVLNSFPENVVATCNNEIAELKMKDKSLFKTSIRFTIAAVIVSVGFFLKKYEVI